MKRLIAKASHLPSRIKKPKNLSPAVVSSSKKNRVDILSSLPARLAIAVACGGLGLLLISSFAATSTNTWNQDTLKTGTLTNTVVNGSGSAARLELASTTTVGATTVPTTANLWINTAAGSCTRQASVATYSAGAACGSIQAALAKCTAGDVIVMKAGTYGSQTITQALVSPGCRVVGENTTSIGGLTTAGAWYQIENVNATSWGDSTAGWHDVTLRNFNVSGNSGIFLDGGGCSSSCSGTSYSNISWIGGSFKNFSCASCAAGMAIYASESTASSNAQIQNFLIEGVAFDNIKNTGGDSNHFEGIRIDGEVNGFTFRKNTLTNIDASSSQIFVSNFRGTTGARNITFENNFFGHNLDPNQGNTFQSNYQNTGPCTTFTFSYNTFLDPAGFWTGCTSNTGNTFQGNLVPNIFGVCSFVGGTYSYNVEYGSGGSACSGTDHVIATSGVGGSDGFHLQTGSGATDKGGTGANCIATDHDGGTRPVGTACDAGADEFGATVPSGGTTTYPSSGTAVYTFDSGVGKSSDWTGLTVSATNPAGTSVTLKSRSSGDNSTWSAWTTVNVSSDVASTPSNRYLQVQATLSTTDSSATPSVSSIALNYTPAAGTDGSSLAPATMPLISRGKPAFASSNAGAAYIASMANDSDYSTTWRSSGPGWLAYDLSSVPAVQRGQVDVAWYNDPITSPYDHVINGQVAYNNLKDYTIEVNPAGTAGSAPTSGWVVKATVTGNTYHSRQHIIDMTSYNWVRINMSASDGSSQNTDAAINLDIHDASKGAQDSWMFYGDSITQDGMHHSPVNGTNNFSQLINAANSSFYPAAEDGGIGNLTSTDGAADIGTWLTVFPGKYVALSYGTNDANSCMSSTVFKNNYTAMIQAVIAANKVPIIPTIPASKTANVQSCGPGLNTVISQLYTAYPQVIHGPDLWAYFQANPTLISGDNLHPSAAGYVAMRQQWVSAMMANIYNGVLHIDSTKPTVSITAPTSGATVSNVISVTATAADDVAVAGVQFKLDGINLQSEVTGSPYTLSWNTSTASNGSHTLTATARDTSGNTATATATITVNNIAPVYTGVHVIGNQLLDGNGQQLILRGVNRAGTEYACIQGWGIFDSNTNSLNDDAQVAFMKAWGINAVNFGINEDCWLGINGVPAAYSGTNYINAIKHEVATLEANGITPIVNYFWGAPGTSQADYQYAMPDSDHAPTTWQSIANTFKSDSKVILRLKEEPYPDGDWNNSAWDCWKNGDYQYDTSNTLTPVSHNAHCTQAYSTVGMQSLINIIRGTGATNVIQVPGIAYANLMNQFLNPTYRVSDTLGAPQLMAVSDIYPGDDPVGNPGDSNPCGTVACYNSDYLPIINVMPFMAGEIGEDPAGTSTTMTQVDNLMNWLDQHNSGYLAWTWNAWGVPLALINNYTDGTPRLPWGVDFKNHLASLSSGDSTAPTPPTALHTTTSSGSSVSLAWTSSTDAVGVTGYRIYRGLTSTSLTQIGSVTTPIPPATSYTDSTVNDGTTYYYAVAAYDAASNLSAQTTALSVATPDTTAPSVPGSLRLNGSVTTTTVPLIWNSSSDNVSVTGYNIYRGPNSSSLTKIGTSATTTYTDSTASASTTYVYAIAAYDAIPNTSAQSTTLSVTTATPPDTTPPTASLTAPSSGAAVSGASVAFSATATDPGSPSSGVATVQFLVDGAAVATDTTSPYSYVWNSQTVSNGSHTITAIATDNAAPTPHSTTSASVTITVNNITPDITAPTVPAALHTTTANTTTSVAFAWTGSTDTGGSNLAGYKIYRNGTLQTSVGPTTTAYSDTGLTPSTTYSYTVSAYDGAGNTSAQSLAFSTRTADVPVPPVVSAITSTGITTTTATITWTTNVAADTQVDYGTTTSYGTTTPLNASLTTSHSVSLTGLTPATTYHYRVRSKDAVPTLTISADGSFTTTSNATGGTPTPPTPPVTPPTSTKVGDVNNDKQVNFTDLIVLLSNYGSTSNTACDLNKNGQVDFGDLILLLSNYGK